MSPKNKPQEQKGDDDEREEVHARRPRHRDQGTDTTTIVDKAKLYDEMYAKFLSDWEIEPGQLPYIFYTALFARLK